MRIPQEISLVVVCCGEEKKFLVSKRYGAFRELSGVKVDEGVLYDHIPVSYFSSRSYFNREVSTPFVLFRNGECVAHGEVEYVGGQDSGYYVVGSITNRAIRLPDPYSFHARDFEEGDVITFLRME